MSTRYFGGIVRKTPLVLDPALGNAANGVFTMSQYMQAVKDGTWPAYDQYFNQTVLLLHGDGTNGAQNNTFLDSSTNNFTITRNGNTTQGTFSPFSAESGKWGNWFNGSTGYLSINDNAALEIGSSSFCVEAWVYLSALPASGARFTLFGKWPTDANLSYIFQIANNSGTTQLTLTYSTTGNTTVDITQNASISTNTWHHVAITRDSTTLRFFLDGVQQGSNQTLSATFYNGNAPLNIGRNQAANANFLNGYLSNARLVVGSAVYTSNFTPTGPLTNITNTSLLTCQSNRFVDNSTNAFAITSNGDVRVTPFSPFAPTAAYSAGTNGGSGYFDGTGDYLTAPDNAVFNLTSGDWTLEAWVYPLTTSNMTILDKDGASGSTYPQYGLNIASNNIRGEVGNGTSGSGYYQAVTGSAVQVGAWNHVAFVKEGTALSVYQNGVRTATATQTGTMVANTRALHIGIVQGATTGLFNGYMSNVRITKGTARYSGTTYTIPTAPFVDSSGTSILLNYTNAGIIDNTGKNNLETVGDAQIDTTVKKYGTGSLEFDGTGDWLQINSGSNDLFNFGTGNFTVECWFYRASTSGRSDLLGRYISTPAGWGIAASVSNSGDIVFYYGNTTIASTAGSTWSANTWTHVAVVRSGTSLVIYVNGVSAATATNSTDMIAGNPLQIGASGSSTQALNGYIDDLRITKGVARYTANFTPQTSQWQDQ